MPAGLGQACFARRSPTPGWTPVLRLLYRAGGHCKFAMDAPLAARLLPQGHVANAEYRLSGTVEQHTAGDLDHHVAAAVGLAILVAQVIDSQVHALLQGGADGRRPGGDRAGADGFRIRSPELHDAVEIAALPRLPILLGDAFDLRCFFDLSPNGYCRERDAEDRGDAEGRYDGWF